MELIIQKNAAQASKLVAAFIEYELRRKAALVLGKCCGALFSPERPVIWSERRLARSVRLVQCDAETFTRSDDE